MLHSVYDFHPSCRLIYHWCKKLCLQEDRFVGHVCELLVGPKGDCNVPV